MVVKKWKIPKYLNNNQDMETLMSFGNLNIDVELDTEVEIDKNKAENIVEKRLEEVYACFGTKPHTKGCRNCHLEEGCDKVNSKNTED